MLRIKKITKIRHVLALCALLVFTGCKSHKISNVRVQALWQDIKSYRYIPNEELNEFDVVQVDCSNAELFALKKLLGEERAHLIANDLNVVAGKDGWLIDRCTGKTTFIISISDIWVEDNRLFVAVCRLIAPTGSMTRVYLFEKQRHNWRYQKTLESDEVSRSLPIH